MDPFFDIDELFGNFEDFSSKFMKRLQKEFEETEKAVKEGKLKGDWDVKQIDQPGVKGYIIQGRFWTDKPFEMFEPLDPFEPFRPRIKRPEPERLFRIPEEASNESREPLTDIFNEDGTVKIYIELPGEEENDIKTEFKEGKLEVKAKKFYKNIDLSTESLDKEKVTSKYKNGVLELIIPKKKFEPELHKL